MQALRVFLVEDSPLMQERLRALMEDIEGVHVISIVDREDDAVRGISQTLPDVVILDLNLSQGSGMSVLWQTKQAYPQVKVFVCTNMGDLQHRKKCHRLGADAFFDKSKGLGAFIGALADLAANQQAREFSPRLH